MIFWAKTDQEKNPGTDVIHHCKIVGKVAEKLFDIKPIAELKENKNQYMALVALHDIGKISKGFQQKCRKWLEKNNLLEEAKNNSWSDHETNHAEVTQYVVSINKEERK